MPSRWYICDHASVCDRSGTCVNAVPYEWVVEGMHPGCELRACKYADNPVRRVLMVPKPAPGSADAREAGSADLDRALEQAEAMRRVIHANCRKCDRIWQGTFSGLPCRRPDRLYPCLFEPFRP